MSTTVSIMYLRVNNIKFSSKIEADAMKALAKYEMINNIPGIISIEVVSVSELHSIVILKFESKEHAEKSKEIYINKFDKKLWWYINKYRNYHYMIPSYLKIIAYSDFVSIFIAFEFFRLFVIHYNYKLFNQNNPTYY